MFIMNSTKVRSGDNDIHSHIFCNEIVNSGTADMSCISNEHIEEKQEVTPQTIEDNEVKLKVRISECKKIIESLKLELDEEKLQIENERRKDNPESIQGSKCFTDAHSLGSSSLYSESVENKLNCDDSLIEYEKQLQKYQNTLAIAQNEKKNAIRKQMITKAFKLKLMEVENQCNIELLRIKQSLQCLEPLQMIANMWKTNTNETCYDINSYDLMATFLELKAHSVSDVNKFKDDVECVGTKDTHRSS